MKDVQRFIDCAKSGSIELGDVFDCQCNITSKTETTTQKEKGNGKYTHLCLM